MNRLTYEREPDVFEIERKREERKQKAYNFKKSGKTTSEVQTSQKDINTQLKHATSDIQDIAKKKNVPTL